MNNKARRICDENGKGIPYVMIISYILEKGQECISQIEDADIDALEGNGLMTADFVKGLVRTAREVVRNCDQSDIVRLIKSEWCCSGEVYDPDLDQYVTDIEDWDDEDNDWCFNCNGGDACNDCPWVTWRDEEEE